MRTITLLSALIALGAGQTGSKPPLRLKAGDTVAVTSLYGGEFKIQNDGAIYGRGFGRLALEGKTWEEAQTAIRQALKPFVRPEEVSLSIRDLRREVVYLIGGGAGRGPVELTPGLTLKQLLASAPLNGDADQTNVQLFREGGKIGDFNAAQLASGEAQIADVPLKADDVVTLAPAPFVRVWITGLAMRTGQLKVPAGTDVYRAIAEAGGVKWPELAADPTWQQYGRVSIHRGPNVTELPIVMNGEPPLILESGDTITIHAPEEARITVAGEVARPGEIVLRGERSLTAGLAHAGGPTAEGTLATVQVFRRGTMYQVDASKAPPAKGGFVLEPGDLVFVPRNERSFLILGEVAKPGKVFMKDGRAYRLSDALAEAGGLSGRGTLRRVFLCRADASGKISASPYNLDEFLKDGRSASNPEVLPGDTLLFGQPKGLTVATASQIVSGALLVDALAGGKR